MMPDDPNTPEPPPTPNDRRPVWDLVIEDMRARDNAGRAKYGTPLQAGNGRDPLVDAYQEALDLAVYLRQAIEERRMARPPSDDATVQALALVHDFGGTYPGDNSNRQRLVRDALAGTLPSYLFDEYDMQRVITAAMMLDPASKAAP